MKPNGAWRDLIALLIVFSSIALTATAAPTGTGFRHSEIGVAAGIQENGAAQDKPALPAADLTQIGSVATKMAEAIESHHFSRVLVLGAKGPGKDPSQLGMIVGDALSASLEKQAAGFRVVTRDAIRDFLTGLDANMEEAVTDDWKDGICEKLGADAFVMGGSKGLDARRQLFPSFSLRR